MTKQISYVLALGLVGAAAWGVTVGPMKGHPRTPMTRDARTPVLVELFTSEGCSSCPPADELLARLQREQPVDGALIVPLSEHVDYWDGASWRDPFSSPFFSARQQAYVRALGVQGPYTPEMVVDGRAEFVGSDEEAARRSIAAAAQAGKANVSVRASFSSTDRVTADITVAAVANGTAEENDVYAVVTENGLDSHVRGGENGGRHLSHTAVVRSLQRIGTLRAGDPFSGEFVLKVNPNWKRADLSIVAFVQTRRRGRILGAGLATPTKS